MLRDHEWKLKYTPDDGDLVRIFYISALEDAQRYDRLTGYFNAAALTLAARGIEGLVRKGGRMRLVVGCTLDPEEIAAIEEGERLRDHVERHLKRLPLDPGDESSYNALELLTWMITRRFLDVKVAVPCNANRKPVPADGIFHEKAGVIQDRAGDKIAWNGSLNETASGWRDNWESINVYTSWGADIRRVDREEANFAALWANEAKRVIVLDMPEAMRRDLLRFMPEGDFPARLRDHGTKLPDSKEPHKPEPGELADIRSRVWSFIQHAPNMPEGGECVGEATAAVIPWPHQVRAFRRLYDKWPPKLLIADEVGLGKTIQAGLLLRQAWLAGRAKRILILAPKAVLNQWQVELREKFNLHWPIYDGRRLVWYQSGPRSARKERSVDWDAWHREPVVLASSHLIRRTDRTAEVFDRAKPWDLIVLDEAHHARRKGAGSWKEGGPNNLLSLMQGLKEKCQGLILLTATPMQVAPVEVWDLLSLFGLPPEWTEKGFKEFFEDLGEPNPTSAAIGRMAKLFRSVERCYGEVEVGDALRVVGSSLFTTNKVLRALRDRASIPIKQLEPHERQAAARLMRANTPIRRLVSRHTRDLLREYFKKGLLTTPIADRKVSDRFLELTPDERTIYDAVDDYIRSTYKQASDHERAAVGLVMVIYRRRLASSFRALGQTLEKRLSALVSGDAAMMGQEEDVPDDETLDEILDAEDVARLENQALAFEERAAIEDLLRRVAALPPDSKARKLKEEISKLREDGYRQVMVFTQYTDTIDFLREDLRRNTDLRLMCFSGRGGEIPGQGEDWLTITRDEAKQRFSSGEADVLICSEAAAEGLNFQFCGALINYDMPWNPMKVEQRIGRIDRLGQKHQTIRIINLHYEDTIETDVYIVLRERINLFEVVVGHLQPILAGLSGRIGRTVLEGADRAQLVEAIAQGIGESRQRGFDIDAVTDDDLVLPQRAPSPITMKDLDTIVRTPELLPLDVKVKPLGQREYKMLVPGTTDYVRVTTDPEYYEKYADSVELWSPGNPLFKTPEVTARTEPSDQKLVEILNQYFHAKA